uniref:Ig-like domain-containing protein n=1 Tax=Poecilia reticulata TaxID=8081 RepID=A0A3P9NEW5_POERE
KFNSIKHVVSVNHSAHFDYPNFTCFSDGDVLYADFGDNVTLHCFYTSSASHLNWYKQVPGEPPQIISTFYKHLPGSNTLHKQFKDNKRLSVYTKEGLYDLKISNIQDSDSALYYCGYTSISVTEFDNGTFLLLKNSSCKTVLHQPDSVSAQPGGSVTLNCTMLTGTVNGDHSVYWFRKNSEGSGLGTLYTTTRSGGLCARSPEDGPAVHSCVYSLPKRNVTMSDAGTYHCAAASCGRILFGPGTRLNVGGKKKQLDPALMHGGVVSLAASLILNIILIFIVWIVFVNLCFCLHLSFFFSNLIFIYHIQRGDVDDLHYAALSLKRSDERHNQEEELVSICVYSSEKSKKK